MLGAQAAREEERARGRMAPAKADHEQRPALAPADQAQIRTRALELAQHAYGFGIITADKVIETASTYAAFIKGESSV